MFKNFCKICCFFVISNLFLACTPVKPKVIQENTEDFIPIFPEDWMGCWEGDLKIYGSDGLKSVVPMAIHHEKTQRKDEFTWALIYGEDRINGRRDYFLKTLDLKKGHFLLDERNDIFIDSYLIGNKMISDYTVEGSQITSVYTLERSQMTFEIFYSLEDGNRLSGNSIIGNDTIPAVISFPVKVYQKAILSKKIPCRELIRQGNEITDTL